MNLLEKKVMGDVYIFYLNKSQDLPFQNGRKISIKKLLVRGDSALIINFMNKTNTPKKKTLVKKILEARKLVK